MTRARNAWRWLIGVQVITFLMVSAGFDEALRVATGLLMLSMMFTFALSVLYRDFLANAGQQRQSAESGGQDVIHAILWAERKGYAVEVGILDGQPAMQAGRWYSTRRDGEPEWKGEFWYDYNKGRFVAFQQQQ